MYDSPAALATALSRSLWQPAPHLNLLSDFLVQALEGRLPRLIVQTPPRHGKSECVSHWFPVWALSLHPEWSIMLCSYEADFAASWGRKARNSAQEHGPTLGLALAPDSGATNRWHTTAGGGMVTAGVGGPIMGRGANVLIVDDPVKNAEEAQSATYRERAWEWWQSTAYTRLEPGGVVIIIGTRWHEDDLIGRLLQQKDEGWVEVRLPALAEADDPLGRAPGAALWPARYDRAALEAIRASVGEYVWQALYQQRPRPREGALFKREQFNIIPPALVPAGLAWARQWDLAASTRTGADYTAGAAVALGADGSLYIRDMIRGRWEWPDAKERIMAEMLREPNTRHGIEKALHGLAAVQDLNRETRVAHVALKAVEVDKDKFSRALAWSTRPVKLVDGPWVGAFLDEVLAFPYGAHDDQVDTVSGGVQMLARFSGRAGSI